MRSTTTIASGALGVAALLLSPGSLPCTSAFIVPPTPLASSTFTASVASSSSLVGQARRQPSSSSDLRMVDQQIILGAGVAFAGIAFGAGLVAFTEAQGERTAERGALSDDTKMRMSAMFMEDDVVQTTDVDDVRARMRNALRSEQTAEELADMTSKARARAEEDADDGW